MYCHTRGIASRRSEAGKGGLAPSRQSRRHLDHVDKEQLRPVMSTRHAIRSGLHWPHSGLVLAASVLRRVLPLRTHAGTNDRTSDLVHPSRAHGPPASAIMLHDELVLRKTPNAKNSPYIIDEAQAVQYRDRVE